MKEPVVVAHSDDRSTRTVTDSSAGWSYLFLLGAGMAVVGTISAVLLFYPSNFASLEWEFGTVASLFDALPLPTLGVGMMTAAAVANDWTTTRRLMVGITLLLTLAVVVLGLVFVLDVPVLMKATNDQNGKEVLKAIAVKTGLMALTYFVLYLALGVWTWRRLRKLKGARG